MKVIEVNNLRKEFISKNRIKKPNGKNYFFKREKVIKNAVRYVTPVYRSEKIEFPNIPKTNKE